MLTKTSDLSPLGKLSKSQWYDIGSSAATMGLNLVAPGLGTAANKLVFENEQFKDKIIGEDEQLANAANASSSSQMAEDAAAKRERQKELDKVVKDSMVTSDPAVQPDIATLNISNTGSALGQISKVMMKKQLAPIESRYTNLKQSAMEANRGNMFMKMSGVSDIAKLSAAQSAELDMDKDGDIDAGDLKAKRQSNITQPVKPKDKQETILPTFTVTYSAKDEAMGGMGMGGQKGISTTKPTQKTLDEFKPKKTNVKK